MLVSCRVYSSGRMVLPMFTGSYALQNLCNHSFSSIHHAHMVGGNTPPPLRYDHLIGGIPLSVMSHLIRGTPPTLLSPSCLRGRVLTSPPFYIYVYPSPLKKRYSHFCRVSFLVSTIRNIHSNKFIKLRVIIVFPSLKSTILSIFFLFSVANPSVNLSRKWNRLNIINFHMEKNLASTKF